MEVYGVSVHKKALIYKALRFFLEFSRVHWSGAWWKRGESNNLIQTIAAELYIEP